MKGKVLFTIFVATVISISAANAQANKVNKTYKPTDFPQLYLTAQTARDRGDLVTAEKLYSAAAQVAVNFPVSDCRQVMALEDLAYCYKAQSKYSLEAPIRKRIISIYQKQFGSDYIRVAQAYAHTAVCYRAQGNTALAILYYNQALASYENCVGPQHLYVAETLADMGQLYIVRGNYAAAESLYRRALFIATHNESNTGLKQALQDELADVLEHEGKIAEAQDLLCSTL